jgi:hypothetical protein
VPAASSVEPPPTSQTMNVLAADAVDATAPAKASAASHRMRGRAHEPGRGPPAVAHAKDDGQNRARVPGR